jgi:hypothetical protein
MLSRQSLLNYFATLKPQRTELLASRTGVEPGRRREREATYCNSMELRGMGSTLPHFEGLTGILIGRLMDA